MTAAPQISTSPSQPSTSAAPRSPEQLWWHHPFGMFQTNLREVDAGLDVERTLDFIQQHGADVWLVNAGGILSFYPTDLPFQTRNPYLAQRPSGDLVGDAVAAAHARGLHLLARMDFSKVSARIAAEHPEWLYVSPEGGSQQYSGLFSVCPSAAYYQDRTFEVLDEVLSRYAVDGFFFNWFGFNEVDYSKVYNGVCHCSSCQRAFKAYSGGERLPEGPRSENYGVWREFAAETIRSLTQRLREHIHSRKPEAFLLGRTADVIFHEANNALGRELWHHATSEAVSAPRAYRPETPVLVNSVAFMDMPYRMAGEQPEHFAHYLVQTISRGGNPSTYIMGTPGQIPYPCLPIAGEITRFHRRYREVYDGMTPCARTGLVRPAQGTRPASAHQESVAEFRGVYSALQEAHIPFDVVPQEHLAEMERNHSLARYAVLVLPDVGELAPEAAHTLDRFVSAGGRLLSTGSSGFAADGAVQLSCVAAERRLAETRGEMLWSTYVAPDHGARAEEHVYAGPIAPVFGAYRYCAWRSGAQPRLELLPRAPFGPPEKAYGHEAVAHPGYVGWPHGQGRSVMFPWTIGRAYRELGLRVVRDLIVNVTCELLGTDERVSADVPEQVEVTLHRSGRRLVVHLVNMSGAKRSSFGSPLPVVQGSLRIRGMSSSAKAYALVSDTPCSLAQDSEGASIEVPSIGLFEVIVVDDPEEIVVDDPEEAAA